MCNIKKCALCKKEIFQIKFNYNFISVSLKWYVNKYVNGFEVYLLWNKCILNKLWHFFY